MRDYVLNMVPIKRRERFSVRNGRVMTYQDAQTREDEQAVWNAYKGELYDGPVAVYIDVFRALPKRTPLRIENEPDIKKPDVDNIAKAVLDGLQEKRDRQGRIVRQAKAFYNDSQVVELHVTKHDRVRKMGDSIRFRVEPRG